MISAEDAKRMYDSGNTIFVDVRKPDYFHRLRVAGAISIPLKGSAERYFQLPRDRDIVVY
jgi:rhodanese-related sulfurtransferase